MKLPLPPLLAIVDADIARSARWPIIDLASAFLSGGAKLMQFRAKAAPGGWLFETASAIVVQAHGANAHVIINDRADIARLSGADGVHVGQDDLAPALVRQIVGRADDCRFLDPYTGAGGCRGRPAGVSYIAIGPVFDTRTKRSDYGRDRPRRRGGSCKSHARSGPASRGDWWHHAGDCTRCHRRWRRLRCRNQRSACGRQAGGSRPRVPRAPHGIISPPA